MLDAPEPAASATVSAWVTTWWPYLATAAVTFIELLTAAHAVLNKRDVRSATAWVGLIVLVPVAGVLLYLLLGINRVTRSGARARGWCRSRSTTRS